MNGGGPLASARRAVVHIGFGKTGSTTVQRSLFSHRSWLLERRVLYPSLAENLSTYFATMFREVPPPLAQVVDPRAGDEASIASLKREYQATLQAEISGTDWSTLVLSAEGLSNARPAEVGRFKAWLDGLGVPDVEILSYVREPVDWSRSLIEQRLRSGDTLEALLAAPPVPNWRGRLSPWIEAFGRDRITIVPFEDARRDGVLGTFCRVAAIPQPEPEPQPANESMSLEACQILSHLNEVRPVFENGKRSVRRRWLGHDLIGRIPGSPFALPDAIRADVFERSRADVAWLNAEFGLSLYTERLLRVPQTESTAEWRPATLDALAELLSDLGNASETAPDVASQPAPPQAGERASAAAEPVAFVRRIRGLGRRISAPRNN